MALVYIAGYITRNDNQAIFITKSMENIPI